MVDWKPPLIVGCLALLILPLIQASAFENNPTIFIPFVLEAPIIDGKWTNPNEWIKGSETEIVHQEKGFKAYLRTLHDGKKIYILLDYVDDQSDTRGITGSFSDQAMVCFDTRNDGGDSFKPDDYCFMFHSIDWLLVSKGAGKTLTKLEEGRKITTVVGFEAVAGFSQINNPYQSGRPHRIYEIAIPIDYLNPSNNYGFRVMIMDGDSRTLLTWPQNDALWRYWSINDPKNCGVTIVDQSIPGQGFYFVCPGYPNSWGNLVSPDNSIPEFPAGLLVLAIFLVAVIIFSKKTSKLNFSFLQKP